VSTQPPGYVYIGNTKTDMFKYIIEFINNKKVMVNGKNMWPRYKYMTFEQNTTEAEVFVGTSMPPDTTPFTTNIGLTARLWKGRFIIFDINQYGSCFPNLTPGMIPPFRKLPNGKCQPTCEKGYILNPSKDACNR
jgi:hypothetical protein